MNLFEINEEIMKCCMDTETGEIINEDYLNELEMERDSKIENIACWIRNLTAEAEALKAQKQVFADRQKSAENKVESLKKYLAAFLDGQKFTTDKVAVSFRKTTSVNVTDFMALPAEFLKYADPTADKTGIKNAIKEGRVVPGAELLEGNSISIK